MADSHSPRTRSHSPHQAPTEPDHLWEHYNHPKVESSINVTINTTMWHCRMKQEGLFIIYQKMVKLLFTQLMLAHKITIRSTQLWMHREWWAMTFSVYLCMYMYKIGAYLSIPDMSPVSVRSSTVHSSVSRFITTGTGFTTDDNCSPQFVSYTYSKP